MQRSYTLHRLLPALCCLLAGFALQAQNLNFTVNGTIVDENKTPLIGVTVLIPSLGTGSITDIDGTYTIEASGPAATYELQYSYVGFTTVAERIEVTRTGQAFTMDVSLGTDVLRMDEVVVIGSSVTSSRRSLGNSITSVKAEELTNANPQGVLSSLQGRVAGAQIVQNSGDPAGGFSVRLRGSSSILGSSDPLYIVDGVVISAATSNVTNTNVDAGAAQPGTNRIADLNPNDIESVEIINGAAAAAIYGSRASNGVVLITTKKGKAGKPQITLSSGLNVNQIREKVYINLRGEQFGSATQRLYPIAGADPVTGGLTVGANFSTDKVPVTRYDYQDEIFDTGMGTDQHLAIKGGNESSNYYAALNYTFNEGIVRNTDFRRYGARLRYNQTVSDWMSISMGLNYNNSYSNEKPDGNVFWSPINTINITNNIWDITQRDELGNLQSVEPTRVNPLSVIEDFDINQEVNRAIADVKVSIFPFEGFSLTYLAGADTYNQLGNTFIPPYPYSPVNPGYFDDGYASTATNQVFQMNHDINGAYTTIVTDNISSTTQFGFSSQFSKNQYTVADGRALAPFVETVSGAANPFAPQSNIARLQIWGYYLQQTFSLKDRLFLTLAGRVDGASSFSPDNRNQFYPKVSGSYLISDEDFWQGSGISNAVSTFRLRASWGQAGNLTGIGPYDRFNNFSTGNLGGDLTINASNTLANPDVRPERQTELEIGADLSLFNDRVGLSATYYQQDIEDLLVERVLPASQGGKAITTNVGNMENKGLEIALTATPVRTSKVSWDVFANFSRNRNKVFNLGQTLIGINNVAGAPIFLVEGEAIGVFYGTYQATNADGSMLLTPDGLRQQERGDVTTNTPSRDADGQPTGDPLRRVIGDPNPDFILGLGSQINVGKLSLGFLFESVQGVDVFDADKRTRQGVGVGEFAEQELTGELPRGWVWSIYPISEWRMSDGSFTKLREITLSYTFDKLFDGALNNTVLTVGGRNLFSIDDFTSYDPEVNAGGQSNLLRGVNFGQVPIPRVYTVTLKTNFQELHKLSKNLKYYDMNRLKIYLKHSGILLLSLLTFAACEKDFTNPGAATEAQVLSTPDGVIGLAAGAQRRFSVGRQSPVYATVAGAGFTTGELRLINPGNAAENGVSLGYADLPGSNGIVTNIWEQCLLTRNEADKVIANADIIPDANTRAWTIAYASIFQALANGTMADFFEQVTLTTEENAIFSSREEAIKAAISSLEKARDILTSDDGGLKERIPADIDIPNTVQALLARYYLLDERYSDAINAANAVDLSVTSTYTYDDVSTNPIAFVSILTNNVYQPIDLTLGLPTDLQPDAADQRLAFYFQDLNPAMNDYRAAAFFDDNKDGIPIYLPGEMLLIKAEAYARQNQLSDAIGALDEVLTKQAGDDAFGIGAGLPAYSGPETQADVLAAIYANRCMEMMMSGLRLGDSKRFNRAGPNDADAERNRNWYPYPFSERDNNPNTPDDPEI